MTTSAPNIFDYTNPVEFLNATLKSIQSQNPRFSLRAFAKQLDLSHVAMLSMVLAKKRRLLPSLSSKISQYFLKTKRFTENEARYFDMLVLFSNASTPGEQLFYQNILVTLRPDRKFSTVDLDHFRIISDWYHFAIVEMTQLKNFTSDLRWICLRLGGSVKESQAQEAIDRLIRVGLLEKTPEGLLTKKIHHYSTPTDISNQAIRNFHAQMIGKALAALETQTVEERDITAHILTISKSKIPGAKAMIRDFRRKLAEFLETPKGDAVYQVNIQLFDALGDQKYV